MVSTFLFAIFILVVCFCSLLSAYLNSPSRKGWRGEEVIKARAHFGLDRHTYRRIDNLILPAPNGTTQIDHIIVSPYGIFVVETKNMSGWIFGSERDAQWTQKFHQKSFRFQNPLRQNYKHIKTLEGMFEVPEEYFNSVVVFVGDCSLKMEMPPNVMRGKALVSYIKSFKERVWTDDDVVKILMRLEFSRLEPGLKSDRQHIVNLDRWQDTSAEMVCPSCGSSMILRTAKRGKNEGSQFWGCSTFPKCRYMHSIK